MYSETLAENVVTSLWRQLPQPYSDNHTYKIKLPDGNDASCYVTHKRGRVAQGTNRRYLHVCYIVPRTLNGEPYGTHKRHWRINMGTFEAVLID